MSGSRKPEIILIAAVAENGVIGRDGDMPWRLSSDLKRFKKVTMGKPVIMGRKTYQSIGRPLPGRLNIVISKSLQTLDGCSVAPDLETALKIAAGSLNQSGENAICVIGGGQIYRQAIGHADRMDITHVQAEVDGDTVFPEISEVDWVRVGDEFVPAGERDSHDMRFATYERSK